VRNAEIRVIVLDFSVFWRYPVFPIIDCEDSCDRIFRSELIGNCPYEDHHHGMHIFSFKVQGKE
jgi:hypothetical protein